MNVAGVPLEIHVNVSDFFIAGYVKLFYNPDHSQTALTFRPDVMEQDEKETFPEYVR